MSGFHPPPFPSCKNLLVWKAFIFLNNCQLAVFLAASRAVVKPLLTEEIVSLGPLKPAHDNTAESSGGIVGILFYNWVTPQTSIESNGHEIRVITR